MNIEPNERVVEPRETPITIPRREPVPTRPTPQPTRREPVREPA